MAKRETEMTTVARDHSSPISFYVSPSAAADIVEAMRQSRMMEYLIFDYAQGDMWIPRWSKNPEFGKPRVACVSLASHIPEYMLQEIPTDRLVEIVRGFLEYRIAYQVIARRSLTGCEP